MRTKQKSFFLLLFFLFFNALSYSNHQTDEIAIIDALSNQGLRYDHLCQMWGWIQQCKSDQIKIYNEIAAAAHKDNYERLKQLGAENKAAIRSEERIKEQQSREALAQQRAQETHRALVASVNHRRSVDRIRGAWNKIPPHPICALLIKNNECSTSWFCLCYVWRFDYYSSNDFWNI